MQYIDKGDSQYSENGHKYVNEFIECAWDSEGGRYVNLSYSNFKSDTKILELLLKQQHNYCCYCMRKINGGNSSIEHIIPQNPIKSDFPFYSHYNFLGPKYIFDLSNNSINNVITTPPFPHIIAYENLVVSCNGNFFKRDKYKHKCCNNKRGSKQIIPLFFIMDISDIISYETDGSINFDEEYFETIEILQLNIDILRMIRKVWYLISRNFSFEKIKSAENDVDIRNEIVDSLGFEDLSINTTFENDEGWSLLLEYEWFYSYYNPSK
jgi:hypothetical protein